MKCCEFDRSYVLFLIVLLPSMCYCEESKATYYDRPDCLGTPTGACGYSEYGRDVNEGNVAAVSRLYRDGAGCGACYQIKCLEPECDDEGVTVVATDHGASGEADFILSRLAFENMAKCGMEEDLKARGHVNVEYERVPCKYPGNNLLLKIHEHSHYPHYLALTFYYQAGVFDIISVEIFEENSLDWRPCRRAYGAVWDMSNPPRGDLTVRMLTTASGKDEAKWVVVPRVIPATWTAGALYDTNFQLY